MVRAIIGGSVAVVLIGVACFLYFNSTASQAVKNGAEALASGQLPSLPPVQPKPTDSVAQQPTTPPVAPPPAMPPTITPVKPPDTAEQTPPPMPKPPEPLKVKKTHVVQAGDSLWVISKKYYGTPDHSAKIAETNRMKLKDTLRIGQVLALPDLPMRVAPDNADHLDDIVLTRDDDADPRPSTLSTTKKVEKPK